MLKCKSVHAKAQQEDGYRILVDLFWPEGLKTRETYVDEWLQELGPSYDLQRFHFSTPNWEKYKSKYVEEMLSSNHKKKLLAEIAKKSQNGDVTLLYGNEDPLHNHAVILKEIIENNFFKHDKS
ncbi:MAG: DUF488 domain-containing protein [bacterium]